MSAYRDIRAAWVCQGLSQSWSGGVFSVIINTTGHTQLLRAFQKYSHVFNTSFFGRKMINDKCAHTHTPVAEHSVASHSFNSPVLVPLIFGGSVLSCRKKNHTSGIRAPKRQNWGSLSGLMVVLKSPGSGRVVIPPGYRADMVRVIAQLISAVKIHMCAFESWRQQKKQCAVILPLHLHQTARVGRNSDHSELCTLW